MALYDQVEIADNIQFYIDGNHYIFSDSTQGDNEVDPLKQKIKTPIDRIRAIIHIHPLIRDTQTNTLKW